MQYLKQSTAVTIKFGPFVDNTDGDTAEVGLTISQADVRLSKNGAAFAQKNEASACTHDEAGWYDCDLDTTDTGGLGRLIVAVHESGALPVWREFTVLPANEFDSLISGSDALDVEVASLASAASNAIADAILCRDWTAVAGEAARSTLNALRFLRNKWSVTAGTLTVTEEDDTTQAWAGTVSTDSGVDPVTGVDPA